MRPNHLEPFGSERRDRPHAWSQDQVSMQAQSRQSTRRSRFEDSWVDLSSQPSSSSLSSQNDRDEIITTGLQLRTDNGRRPRQPRLDNLNAARNPRSTSAAGSSQDEYDESESESDRVLSSSNEDIAQPSHADEDEQEEEDAQTALGMPAVDRNIFTPQPNAFSHPPTARGAAQVSNSMPLDSYFPPQAQPPPSSSHRLPSNRVPTIHRPQQQQQQQQQPRASSNISPDHDAALRASLTTLLSCANAVRKERDPVQPQSVRRSNQPTVLRLVPESQLHGREKASPPQSPKTASKRRSREASKERQAKKLKAVTRTAPHEEMLVSPTMMTWFISAGVVFVFSAIGFSVGYAWGKEVGRIEGQMGLDGSTCGRSAIRGSRSGLSKLRLSAVGA